MTDTPKQAGPDGAPDGGDRGKHPKTHSGALDPKLAELNEALAERIDHTLRAYDTVLTRLRKALEAHAIKVEEGSLEHRKIGEDLRQFLPVLTATLQQENKVHDTIEQRVGKAGKYAFDLARARSEISGRLARINGARRGGELS